MRVRLDPVLPDLQERGVAGSRGPICAHYFFPLFVNIRVIIIAATVIV